jgi:predicted GIY-YIG superfamily endonuclease
MTSRKANGPRENANEKAKKLSVTAKRMRIWRGTLRKSGKRGCSRVYAVDDAKKRESRLRGFSPNAVKLLLSQIPEQLLRRVSKSDVGKRAYYILIGEKRLKWRCAVVQEVVQARDLPFPYVVFKQRPEGRRTAPTCTVAGEYVCLAHPCLTLSVGKVSEKLVGVPVYVIACARCGRRYVGESEVPIERVKHHRANKGAKWTQESESCKHVWVDAPLLTTYQQARSMGLTREECERQAQAKKYGGKCVRGAGFTCSQ